MEQYANNRSPRWGIRRALFQGIRGALPPEAETLLAFARSVKDTNLPAFNI